ncbi:MAG: hypothetical protein ABIP94_11505 [Planctomycetota bacterium]
MKVRAVWCLFAAGACVARSDQTGSESPLATPAAPAASAPHLQAVRITFEPPLDQPGWLLVEHESGAQDKVPTSRTGVEVLLPKGPASLRLEVGGQVWQRPVLVSAAGEDIVWNLRR